MTCKGINEETHKALTIVNLTLDYGVQRHYLNENPARMLKPKDFGASALKPVDRALICAGIKSFLAINRCQSGYMSKFATNCSDVTCYCYCSENIGFNRCQKTRSSRDDLKRAGFGIGNLEAGSQPNKE